MMVLQCVGLLISLTLHLLASRRCRSGYHAAALPFELRGIGGPGAPHFFHFVRRADSGQKFRSRNLKMQVCPFVVAVVF